MSDMAYGARGEIREGDSEIGRISEKTASVASGCGSAASSGTDICLREVHVELPLPKGWLHVVDDVTVTFRQGLLTAIIGESGCGKSLLGQAVLGVLPPNAVKRGEILLEDRNIFDIPVWERQGFGIIPQNPAGALSPVRRIGRQMQDILDTVGIADQDDTVKKEHLRTFGIQEPERVLAAYPFEMSGGMLQRILCAMSICGSPRWILADEPTKGLDEKVAETVYENLLTIRHRQRCSMILITHDMKLAETVCDCVAVMYAGQVVEYGCDVFCNPLHPYTQGFFNARPEAGLNVIKGDTFDLSSNASGCKFAARCPYCKDICRKERPGEYEVDGTWVRCYRYA